VDHDAREPTSRAVVEGDVEGEAIAAVQEPEQLPGRAVTEECAGPAGFHGGEPGALLAEHGRGNGREDTSVEAVKVTSADPKSDR